MCGIVGYIGTDKKVPVIIDALKRLEYRGYDSSGIALLMKDGNVFIEKKKGPISVLESELAEIWDSDDVLFGIAHTRWATHGEPNDVNAHPHTDCTGKIAVVHNGIIENFQHLKDMLIKEGHIFKSDTDTEVIAHLIEKYLKETGDPFGAFKKAIDTLEGAYALAVIIADEKDKIFFVRQQSPMVIGKSDSGTYIASDIPAILSYTRDIMPLEDGTYGYIDGKDVVLFDKNGNRIPFKPIKIDWDIESAEKKGYPHFMLKEIHEQPQTVQDALRGRIDIAKSEITMPELDSLVNKLKTAKKVYITACGTAFHAGLVLKYLLKTYTDLSVEADVGSEFRYMPWDLSRDKDDSIAVVISQSGETADTIAAMRLIKSYDIPVIGIVNVVGSTIYRESNVPLVINAGPEIAVASTKAYTNQLIVSYLLAMYIAKLRGFIDKQFEHQFVSDMLALPNLISTVLGVEDTVKDIASQIKDTSNVFFIGRLLDHLTNMEGSLKLKEISYIHSEAIQAGELKHGPLALISEGTPVIATVLQDRIKEKQISNIIEVRARKAKTIVLGYRDDIEAQSVADMFIGLPRVSSLFAPIAGIIPLQLLAYHVAVMRGNNVDKPRNLAKSVTVE